MFALVCQPLMMLNERESGLEIEKLYLFRLSDLSAVIDTYSDNRIWLIALLKNLQILHAATIQIMIVLIDTSSYWMFNEYCYYYVYCYNLLLKTNKQAVILIPHLFGINCLKLCY